MKKCCRAAARLLAAALCLGLFLPLPARAAEVYFTSVNDSLLQLSAETMPFWSGGMLFVPYGIFDGKNTGIDLGLSCGYERDKNTVSIFNLRSILTFDLSTGTCWNEQTGKQIFGRATVRDGRIYVSLSAVCGFFGLDYSYTALSNISQGYLVRIKSGAVVLSDAKFIDAADDLIRRRFREYSQTSDPGRVPSASAPTVTPAQGEPASASVSTFLAFRCESAAGIPEILDALEGAGACGLFFLTPQTIEEEGALVRRIWGSGHSVGVLSQGEELPQVRAELEGGARLLEGALRLRVTLACVPKGMSRELESEGWVCWNETLSLAPDSDTGAGTFAANTLRRLSGRTGDVYLTVEGDRNAARVLPTLLRRLAAENFVTEIPVETRL